jgi:ribosome small subunit-dependent GTPase A
MMMPEKNGVPARITASHRGRYELVCEYGACSAVLKKSAYYSDSDGARDEQFPTVGDFVALDYHAGGESFITSTLERRSYFSRRDPSASGYGEQAVAANFDYVLILQALGHDFNLRRLERYLAQAWSSGALPVVLLTKCDLVDDFSTQLRAAEKSAQGTGVFAVSAVTGYGTERLDDYLKPRKTAVLLGSSGAGKSSLINRLAGHEVMAAGEVRADDERGRHTTTHRQLIMLPSGAMVIDTPGMRELGVWNADEGLDSAFSDVTKFLGKCKFSDCRHGNEPGCAVKTAIMSGELSQERWESYSKLKGEASYSTDKEGYLRAKTERFKSIAKTQKQLKKLEAVMQTTPDYRREPCAESFVCRACGAPVAPEGAGTEHRNHCPKCLCSVHLDNTPGDRASLCGGVMDPIGVWVKKNGEWAIIHRCRDCGKITSNRIAADDNQLLLMSIAVKPLAAPPFPLGMLEGDNAGEPGAV